MQVANAAVHMESSHQLRTVDTRTESLRMWRGSQRPALRETDAAGAINGDSVRISSQGMIRQRAVSHETGMKHPAPPEDPRLMTMWVILEALTGRKIAVAAMQPGRPADAQEFALRHTPSTQKENQAQDWGLEYDATLTHQEQEEMRVSASGTILTADGQEIRFNLELGMQREMVESTDIAIRAGDARLMDPLVVNFDGPAAALSDLRFAFDLDNDGNQEQLATLGPGSGFLVLDRNGDSQVNNGGELFGPASGDGFAELAALDGDGNGWLDAGDPMFEKLRIWTREAAGGDALSSLADKGIGALFLGAIESPFSLSGQDNTLLGRIAKTGLFLRENGAVGTLQHIDLAL